MRVIFFNVIKGDPTELEMEQVPRRNEEITLNSGITYLVESVRWQATSEGLREAGLTLQTIKDPD